MLFLYVMCIPSITVLATRQIILYNLIAIIRNFLFTILFNDVLFIITMFYESSLMDTQEVSYHNVLYYSVNA